MREAVKTFYPFLGGEFDSNRGRACFALPCLVAFAFFLRLFFSGLPIPNLSAYVADVLIYDPIALSTHTDQQTNDERTRATCDQDLPTNRQDSRLFRTQDLNIPTANYVWTGRTSFSPVRNCDFFFTHGGPALSDKILIF